MPPIPPSQITILAIGVENYNYMHTLRGTVTDVQNLHELLVNDPNTALFTNNQFISLIDPDSASLRDAINLYVSSRTAAGDVLIFYFSGHGAPIGQNDFAFCTKDSKRHDLAESVLPLSVLRFRDLIDSLRMVNVIPFVIIDACYSGIAGNNVDVSATDALSIVRREITGQNGTSYALLCSCAGQQVSYGNVNGGYFSQAIISILKDGIPTNDLDRINIHLQDIVVSLSNRIAGLPAESTPQLFCGETLPKIPLVKNTKFSLQRYSYAPYLDAIVLALWNNGNEIELSPGEILSSVGRGAYGNHRKLSYSGWGLVEDNPKNKKRRLSEKGRLYVKREISIPDQVIYDPVLNDFIASPNAQYITLDS